SFVLRGGNMTTLSGASSNADTKLWIYSQTAAGNSSYSGTTLLRYNTTSITGLVPAAAPYGMYLVWLENSTGVSYPVRINATEAWWVGPNHGVAGASISVYGRNLSNGNGESRSYVYVRPWGSDSSSASVAATVTQVNPNKITFTLPSGLQTNRDYEVWVHN